MKMKLTLLLTLICVALTTACSQANQTPPVNRKTPLFENAVQAQERANTMAAARAFLAVQTGLAPDDIQFLRYEPTTFNNLCLDYPDSQEICPADTVSGYKFFFVVNNYLYEVHSNQNGNNIRLSPEIAFSKPPIENMITLLSSQLDIPPEQIRFLNSEQVIWQDTCLELPSQNDCQPAEIPGFKILLEARQQQFEYHTDLDGKLIFGNLVSQTSEEPLLTWQTTRDDCFNLDFYREIVVLKACDNSTQTQATLSTQDQAELLTLLTTYAPFLKATSSGVIHLFGLGSAKVTEAGSTSITEWVNTVYQQLFPPAATSDPLMDYLLLSMERRYFNATVIERLVISRDLAIVVSDNEGFEKRDLKLSESQAMELMTWGRDFAADQFIVRDENGQWETELNFYGNGKQTLTESDRLEMVTFALQAYAENTSGDTK